MVSFVYLLVCWCLTTLALLVFLLSHVKLFFLPVCKRMARLDGNALHVDCKKQTYIARDSDPAQRQVIPNQ
jgi:hypothetical protein